jgi:O-antigen/teichoic acid export membrane protein
MALSRSNLFSIFKNSAATVVARGAFGAARIVMLLLIASAFGAAEFGALSLALAFIEIFKVIADVGIDVATIRRFAAIPESSSKLLNNALSLKLLFSTSAMVVAPLVFFLLYGSAGLNLLLVALPAIATGLLTNAFLSYFQAKLSMARAMVSYLAGVGVYVGLTSVALILRLPLALLVAVIPLSELSSLWLLSKKYAMDVPLRLELDHHLVRELLHESVFVGISSTIVVVYLRLDNLMISLLLGNEWLGKYAVAFRLIEAPSLLFSSLSVSLYASLSGNWVKAPAENYQSIKRVLLVVAGITAAAIFVLVFVVRPLLPLLSPQYEDSERVLIVLSLSLLFKGVNPQLTGMLNSLGKFRILVWITVGNLAVSFILNIVLIPAYGIVGAALAVLFTELINSLVQTGTVLHVLPRSLKQS